MVVASSEGTVVLQQPKEMVFLHLITVFLPRIFPMCVKRTQTWVFLITWSLIGVTSL